MPVPATLVLHDHADALAAAVARRITEIAGANIAARGVFRLALAGGETPRRCYEQLRSLSLDWTRTQIFFGDERCLPQGDVQRNDVMARTALLQHIDIPAANIHPIAAELGADIAATEYAAHFTLHAPLDLVLLGLGEDGHTASLFPANPATEFDAAVVPVFDAPKPPPQRVSLGMTTLLAARQRLFLVSGSGKRNALAQIFSGEALPAARVGVAEWHIDRDAMPQQI